jgi:sugar phosphate isomerase/epimerase
MNGMLGPGLFLAQFLRDAPPYNDIKTLAPWAARLGYKGLQIPTWDRRVFHLEEAAASQAYCDDFRAGLAGCGLRVTELCAALQGQVLAIHPAYERMFEAFYPRGLSGAAMASGRPRGSARPSRRRPAWAPRPSPCSRAGLPGTWPTPGRSGRRGSSTKHSRSSPGAGGRSWTRPARRG